MEKTNQKQPKPENVAENNDFGINIKDKSPIEGTTMISVPKSGASLNPYKNTSSEKTKSKKNPFTENKNLNSIIKTINQFNISKPKESHPFPIATSKISYSLNNPEILRDLMFAFQTNTGVIDLFNKLKNIFIDKMDWNFVGFGIYQEKSKCINLKLYSNAGNAYTSKIFMSDEKNPIIECFNSKNIMETDNIDYLNIPYLEKNDSVLCPMISIDKCVGVLLIGQSMYNLNKHSINFLSNYTGMFLHNIQLLEQTNKFANTDTLTSLYNHRGFQEVLSKELAKAKDNGTNLSVIMFDVNNITKINRELGHAKGDEVIKIIAEKVKQNIRNTDSAGRYGGDEIAVIMPDTNTHDAKYMAEYITYSLSCCFVDDIGPVKVSVGISTYPESAQEQEKLLVLAEQAMFISQAKGYKEGMSAIISSQDFNFWDDVAINSFAEILAKRHFEIGINFEEELVKKLNNSDIINHTNLMEIVTSLN